MSDDAKPDYTTMSGAEFKREVGIDPEKWAEAFEQQSQRSITGDEAWLRTHEQRVEYLTQWFRDAMEAAVKHAVAPRWDQQYSDADLEAAAKQAAPEWEENRRRAKVAREHEVARRHSGKPSD